jgi:Xaa-Pro aminopeptidase
MSGSLFQTDFTPAELAGRRTAVLEGIGADAVAVVQGAPPPHGFQTFRQSNQFYYLCGVEMPMCCLLLDGRDGRTTLFLPDPSTQAGSEGESLAEAEPDVLAEVTGVDVVARVDSLADALKDARILYAPYRPAERAMGSRDELTRANRNMANDPWDGRATREGRFIGLLRARCPRADVRDLSHILDRLRSVKSAAEVALCREAGRLSGLAVMEAMRSTRPGVIEYQLGAVAEYIFILNGARGGGYRPIIASGANIWFSHYFRNDAPLQDGDLVLMDYAPDYRGYTSDIGRMFPVNGTYSPLQRELYGFVVAYHKAVLERIGPGLTADEVHAGAAEAMADVVAGAPWSKPVYEAAARRMLEFKGHLSHPVGMAVHDVGGYRDRPLESGVVLTVDPQMWVPEEKLYVRVEDTVVVTEEGIESFTGFVPLDLDDVEALMRQDGMIQAYPPEG